MKQIAIILFASIAIASCTYKQQSTCSTSNITYTNSIQGIMASSCTAGCHSGATPSAGISLDSYASVSSNAAVASFMGSINHESSYSAMPKAANKLDACTISKLTAWIAAGKPQ